MAWPPDVADDVDVIAAAHTNAIKNSVKTWPGPVDANSNPITNLTSAEIEVWHATTGPRLTLNNPNNVQGSGGEIEHKCAGARHGALKIQIGEGPIYGTEYVFDSAGVTVAKIRSAHYGMDLLSVLGAGSGISPTFNLQNNATNISDGVEIRHTAGVLRGQLQMRIGQSPYGSDFRLLSNGVEIASFLNSGRVKFGLLPTSSAGLGAGELYKDGGGFVKQV